MALDEKCREVLEKTEWLSMTTSSKDGPHTVAAWGFRLRQVGIKENGIIVLPAAKYFQTENNLKADPRVQLLAVSSDVQKTDGTKGQGYRISGTGEIQTAGEIAELIKIQFPWARGALVIKIERIEALLS